MTTTKEQDQERSTPVSSSPASAGGVRGEGAEALSWEEQLDELMDAYADAEGEAAVAADTVGDEPYRGAAAQATAARVALKAHIEQHVQHLTAEVARMREENERATARHEVTMRALQWANDAIRSVTHSEDMEDAIAELERMADRDPSLSASATGTTDVEK